MKDSGKWAVVFTVLNIILITVCVVLLLNKDRKPPIISFSGNDLIYYSGIDNEKLLQGVGAVDAKDGDVTDRIVVCLLYTSSCHASGYSSLKGLHSEPHASEAGYRIAAVTGTVQYTAACGSDVYEDEQSYFPEYADPAFESLL